MGNGSLRIRLALFAALAISLALALAGFGFYLQFQKHAQNLMLQEFDAHFEQLASLVNVDANNKLQVDGELSDPRFSTQYGGLYWQVDVQGQEPVRSRSLWDYKLTVPTAPKTAEEEAHIHILQGPDNTNLLGLERMVSFERPDGGTMPTVVTIAMDRSAVSNAISAFSTDMTMGLSILYIILLGASILQVLFGLRPLEALRQKLENVRSGQAQRMAGNFPNEVQPLVNEVNSLLDAREDQLKRARNRAGNLAHGLKTPLTVLDAIAGDLEGGGKSTEAKEIRLVASDMRNLVERELARARSSSHHGSVQTPLLPALQRVRDALNKGSDKPVAWHFNVAGNAAISIEKADLFELIGNLLENAHKFADANVYVSFEGNSLSVEDDGPGVPDDKVDHILQRGARLDEQKPGSGLGLAIVQDMVDAYGARLLMSRSQHGGLRVLIVADQPKS